MMPTRSSIISKAAITTLPFADLLMPIAMQAPDRELSAITCLHIVEIVLLITVIRQENYLELLVHLSGLQLAPQYPQYHV